MPATWGRVPVWWVQFLRQRNASRMALDVLLVLAAHAGKPKGDHPNVAWPSIEEIAATLSVKPHAVKMGIAELKAVGLVCVRARNRRRGESNVYTLAVAEPFQVANPATHKPHNHVAEPATQKTPIRLPDRDESGCHIGTDQVGDHAQNPPITSQEPTREPTVLTTFVPGDALSRAPSTNSNGTIRTSDVSIFAELLGRCAIDYPSEHPPLNPKTEAERLVRLFPSADDRDELYEHLGAILAYPDSERTLRSRIALACGAVEKAVPAKAAC